MIYKFNKKFVIAIILGLLVTCIISLVMGEESLDMMYVTFIFILIVDYEKPKKCEYVFGVVIIIGIIVTIVNAFYKNIYLINIWNIIGFSCALWTYTFNVKTKSIAK